MSIIARYENGVFRPLEEVKGASKDTVYRVFSEEELRSLKDDPGWLNGAEPSFRFWDNEEDSVYDRL